MISTHSRVPQAVDVEVFIVAEGMARTKNTISREETGVEQLKGVRGGRIRITTSEAAGKELAIRTSQVNAAQRLKTDSTDESEQVSGEESSDDKEESGEKMEEKVIVVKNQRRGVEKKEKVIQDQVQGKAGTPKGKKPTDDTSTPFPRGPKNQTLLKSFKNHVAAAIWNGERVRRAVEVVTARKALPPGVGDRASALKMTDEVLKHLIVVGSSVTLVSTTFAATPSQLPTSKRKATEAKTEI
ncbi:hypothetical protein Scep_026189 [Stephania cephalantha]|uniref:Uncharacterized protein n=1 Tax=Stephania cephalantha TaxID=152367 RepID=A0AAP0EJN4_9MAGN